MIENLVERIKQANDLYRIGTPIMTDLEWDELVEQLYELDPYNSVLDDIGFKVKDESRKVDLPIIMASMNKIKGTEELENWARLRGIDMRTEVVITPKYDGISLCVNESDNKAYTRGDGKVGQKSDDHYKLISNKLGMCNKFQFTYGEVIMPKSKFETNYSDDFANPRNLVAGLLNAKEISKILSDCHYIKYGAIPMNKSDFRFKSHILDELNKYQEIPVNYLVCKLSDISEDKLVDIFNNWSFDYEIDGLIIEVNDLELQELLGRETSTNNPVWARAYKSPSFEKSVETEIIGISWNISKQGLIKPTIHINPVKLDGVTISNVTGNNAGWIRDMRIGVGSIVRIVRSGMVIPMIKEVITFSEFKMPDIPNIKWNDKLIELVTEFETEEQRFKQMVSFFQILEADGVSEGIIKQIWDAGFKTVKEILNLTTSDLVKIPRFGKRKSDIVYKSIQKSITNVQLSKLQHATGFFPGLGSRKLVLLEDFDKKPTIEEVMKIEGFAQISAVSYVENWDKFFNFIKDLPITINKKVQPNKTGNDLEGEQFVYTGLRDKTTEDIIISRGGKIGSSVSKNTNYLICKDPNSGSSKLEKAKSLGIKIMSLEDLVNLLK